MISDLKAFGLNSPYRSKRLMEQSIIARNLNLGGLIVLTEAGSNNYVHTPILAALAGSNKVYAVTRDSIYGKASEIASFTYALAEFCGVSEKIKVVTEKTYEIVKEADIITNLGFVRPINAEMVGWMKDKAVIPLMFEAWEFRTGDVDLSACYERGIPVIATNEDAPGLEVFKFSGPLCIKMLFEAQIEVYKCKIIVISSDKFGEVIYQSLKSLGANVYLAKELRSNEVKCNLREIDAIVISDYTSTDTFIGTDGQISVDELKQLCPEVVIIQFAGKVNTSELASQDIMFYPYRQVGAYRMGMTLADLGPKPIIDLHCAGLRVGEIFARGRLQGFSVNEIKDQFAKNPLFQLI